MKAASIVLRDMRGQIAGAIIHASEASARLAVLTKVAEDVSSGVAPLEGLSQRNAEAMRETLAREVVALDVLEEQLRLVEAYAGVLAARLPGSAV